MYTFFRFDGEFQIFEGVDYDGSVIPDIYQYEQTTAHSGWATLVIQQKNVNQTGEKCLSSLVATYRHQTSGGSEQWKQSSVELTFTK